jgi:hypothetical protein
MGIIQDALLASARMTRRGIFIQRDLLMNLMMQLESGRNKNSKVIDMVGNFIIPEPALSMNLTRLSRFKNNVFCKDKEGFFTLWTGK